MNFKNIYTILDVIFGTISGVAFLDLLPLLVLNGGGVIFENIDNGIKIISFVISMCYFVLRIYFYYHKSKGDLVYQKQLTIELELKNKEHEIKNMLFGKEFAEMAEDEFKKSSNRIKNK